MPGSDKHSYFPCRAKNSYFPNVVSVSQSKTLVKSYLGFVCTSIDPTMLACGKILGIHNNTDMYYLPSQIDIETTNLKYERWNTVIFSRYEESKVMKHSHFILLILIFCNAVQFIFLLKIGSYYISRSYRGCDYR